MLSRTRENTSLSSDRAADLSGELNTSVMAENIPECSL
jgi:hypothetical protein